MVQKRAKWGDLHEWCERVQRDIIALEVWAKRQDSSFRPGGGPRQKGDDLRRRIENLADEWAYLARARDGGDPGDPPKGPFA